MAVWVLEGVRRTRTASTLRAATVRFASIAGILLRCREPPVGVNSGSSHAHLIISSALACSVFGTVRPRALIRVIGRLRLERGFSSAPQFPPLRPNQMPARAANETSVRRAFTAISSAGGMPRTSGRGGGGPG
jgi:hypothetical protein